MKRLVLALALALGLIAGSPIVVPEHAPPAAALAVYYAWTTDGILWYQWMWVSTPGQPNGGFWTLINVVPD